MCYPITHSNVIFLCWVTVIVFSQQVFQLGSLVMCCTSMQTVTSWVSSSHDDRVLLLTGPSNPKIDQERHRLALSAFLFSYDSVLVFADPSISRTDYVVFLQSLRQKHTMYQDLCTARYNEPRTETPKITSLENMSRTWKTRSPIKYVNTKHQPSVKCEEESKTIQNTCQNYITHQEQSKVRCKKKQIGVHKSTRLILKKLWRELGRRLDKSKINAIIPWDKPKISS